MAARPTILVFDSRLSRMIVLREVVAARPDARYVYAAYDAFFTMAATARRRWRPDSPR